MKCPNCDGLGYLVMMRPAVFGKPIEPQLACTLCKGTGIVPDPAAPFCCSNEAQENAREARASSQSLA
jgi:hypothetical protein